MLSEKQITTFRNNLAPIVLFVYNRPWHTQQTVEALQKNKLAKNSELIIYSDGAKNENNQKTIEQIRKYIRSITGFKSIKIIERKKNWGLSDSIIDGVTNVVNEYGKIIVLEDDIVTSPAFLSFMNGTLNFYENEKKVWHISGWNYPIEPDGLGDVFLWRVMNCWGWATWKDRWRYFDKNPQGLIDNWTDEEKYNFDLGNTGVFWPQVLHNASGKINTWAVFWYATIFENQGLCLNPVVSYVDNIGHDGSGVHCGEETSHRSVKFSDKVEMVFSDIIIESELAVSRVQDFYKKLKKPFHVRVTNRFALKLPLSYPWVLISRVISKIKRDLRIFWG